MARRVAPLLLGVLAIVLALAFASSASASAKRPPAHHKHRRVTVSHFGLAKSPAAKRKPRPRPKPAPRPVSTVALDTPAAAPLPLPAPAAPAASLVSPVSPPPPAPAPAPSPSPVPASAGLIVGLNANVAGWGGASTAPRLDLVTGATDTKWLREEIDWATVEPQPGVFDFSYYDHFMLLCRPARNARPARALRHAVVGRPGLQRNPVGPDGVCPVRRRRRDATALTAASGPRTRPSRARPSPPGSSGTSHTWQRRQRRLRPRRLRATGGSGGHRRPWRRPEREVLDGGRDAVGDDRRRLAVVGRRALPGRPQPQQLLRRRCDARLRQRRHHAQPDRRRPALPQLRPHPPYRGPPPAIHQPQRRQQAVLDHRGRLGDLHRLQNSDCVSDAQQATNLSTLFNDIHNSWSSWVQAAFIYSYGDGSDPSTIQDAYGLTNLDGSAKPLLPISRAQAAASAS